MLPEKKMNVLIVEDEYISRSLLTELLAPFAECIAVGSGEEALEILKQSYAHDELFDLVCLDIMMPDLNGQQVLQELRRIEGERHIDSRSAATVFMTTAQKDVQNVLEAFTKGSCQAYLTKPIDRMKLVYHLRQCQLVN